MLPADRLKNWINDLAAEWNERLRDWMSSWLSWGIELFFDVLGKAAAPKFKPLIDTLEATEKIPPELRPLFDEIKSPTTQASGMLANAAAGSAVGGAVNVILEQLLADVSRALASKMRKTWIELPIAMEGYKRGDISEEQLNDFLSYSGFPDDQQKVLKELVTIRLDPASVMTAWRREPAKYEAFIKDLKDTGWSDERIEALKVVTQAFPALADVIRFYAKEVFEPDMIARYGLEDELPPYEGTLFEKLGVSEKTAKMYWMAHWEHASWTQVIEMLRRGQLTQEEVYEWYRVVEIPPYWRDKLTAISWNVPTRVDVRRWWDMRTIDEARLREVYQWQGYHGKDLDDYVLWTKVYVAFPDLIARFKNGWITEGDVKGELIAMGMPADRVEEMWQAKFTKQKAAQVEEERKATATEIMKGVKTGYITRTEGIEMLCDLGYDEETASFKLDVYLGVSAGSPDTYSEFKSWTQSYRKALGLSFVEIPTELIEAEKALKDTVAERDKAIEGKLSEDKLSPYVKAVSDAEYRYRQLLNKWKAEQKA